MQFPPEMIHQLEESPALDVLTWAVESFHPAIKLACSFSAEDMVVLEMLRKIASTPRVFMLDTGRLPDETYDLMEHLRRRYGLKVELYFPAAQAVEQMVREHGTNLFYRSVALRKACCRVRKVEPLRRALADARAWITGLRREQSPTRTAVKKVEEDEAHGAIVKINPLADWSYNQVWQFIQEHEVPYHRLYDKGYTSIGCAPCTRAIEPGESERAGRWWWEAPESKECGIHDQANAQSHSD